MGDASFRFLGLLASLLAANRWGRLLGRTRNCLLPGWACSPRYSVAVVQVDPPSGAANGAILCQIATNDLDQLVTYTESGMDDESEQLALVCQASATLLPMS